MNFQQLRYVREAVRNNLNLTVAARILNTSQSGVSKQIRELEIELGVEIFVRKGKRLTGLTRAGDGVVGQIDRVLLEAENLKRFSSQFSGEETGRLVIAATHNQARYALPDIISRFAAEFPAVQLELHQSTPAQAARSVLGGEADIAIATEALDQVAGLVAFPCFSWRHVVVAPRGHALAKISEPTLEDVAAWPLITYSPEFSGRAQIDAAFRDADLTPDIRLAAMDADVIKDYVRRNLGVGVLSEMAMSRAADDDLVELPSTRSLFPPSATKIAFLRGALLHAYGYRLIELFAPWLDPARLREAGLARISVRGPAARPPAASIPSFSEFLARQESAGKSGRKLAAGG
jgi:LysR family cys regulon transcriptional activator